MALGTATVQKKAGAKPMAPVYLDVISFAGDGAYPGNGTAAFAAYVKAALADGREVLAVVDCGSNETYYPVYDQGNDKLVIYVRATGVENATADISAQTFRMLVISK